MKFSGFVILIGSLSNAHRRIILCTEKHEVAEALAPVYVRDEPSNRLVARTKDGEVVWDEVLNEGSTDDMLFEMIEDIAYQARLNPNVSIVIDNPLDVEAASIQVTFVQQ